MSFSENIGQSTDSFARVCTRVNERTLRPTVVCDTAQRVPLGSYEPYEHAVPVLWAYANQWQVACMCRVLETGLLEHIKASATPVSRRSSCPPWETVGWFVTRGNGFSIATNRPRKHCHQPRNYGRPIPLMPDEFN